MKTKLTSILAIGKKYQPSLQNEHGQRVLSVLVLMLAFSMFAIGRWSSPTPLLLQKAIADTRLEVVQQQQLLDQLSHEQETGINALAARLAELQAASTRLDALGERLVQLGQLDPEEFDFSQAPPVGGPERNLTGNQTSAADMLQAIDLMSNVLQGQFA